MGYAARTTYWNENDNTIDGVATNALRQPNARAQPR